MTKELMQQRTHAYCVLCKPYIPKVERVRERGGGEQEEQEEQPSAGISRLGIHSLEIRRRGTETCMLFMKTSNSTLSSSYDNTDIYHNKAL